MVEVINLQNPLSAVGISMHIYLTPKAIQHFSCQCQSSSISGYHINKKLKCYYQKRTFYKLVFNKFQLFGIHFILVSS